jgi:lysophospholipase L1-like esterase
MTSHKLTTVFVGVLAVLLGGRVRAAPVKVAGVGDSITQLSQWPQKLGTLLGAGYAVTNYGVVGATLLKKGDSPYWNTTAFTQSHAANPDVVVIMLGTNDSKPFNWNVHMGEFVGDYEALIDSYTALPSHPKVYLNLCPPAGTNGYQIDGKVIANQILPLIEQVAIAKGVPTIDVYDAFGGPNLDQSLYGSPGDLVHPNDKGGMVIAQTVYAALTAPAVDGGADTASSEGGGAASDSGATTTDATSGVDAAGTGGAPGTSAAAGSGAGGAAGGPGATGGGPDGTSGGAGDTGAAGQRVMSPAKGSSGGCALTGERAGSSALAAVVGIAALVLARRRRSR